MQGLDFLLHKTGGFVLFCMRKNKIKHDCLFVLAKFRIFVFRYYDAFLQGISLRTFSSCEVLQIAV